MVLGKRACEEVVPRVRAAYDNVDVLDTCGHCDNLLNTALWRLKVSTFSLSPVSAPRVIFLLALGKMKGLRYELPG
jgi:hypothetical protein